MFSKRRVKVNPLMQNANRKESNDQESIKLPNTFRPRHQRERRTHLKQRHKENTTNQNKQKAKRTVFFPKNGQTAIQNKHFTKIYMQRHTMTEIVNHSRSTVLERSVNTFLWVGVGTSLDFTWLKPSPLVLPWYTQDITSSSLRVKGFSLISATSQSTKKLNEYKDETTMRTRQQEITKMLNQKKTSRRTPVGQT